MTIISLNIGCSKEIEWKGKIFQTSIYKNPVNGKRKVTFNSIEGDNQSDLINHGGTNKAIYAYSLEYYEVWKDYIDIELNEFGLFGENLTTKGLLDSEVKIGNIYKVGTTFLQVIQPRFPCFKLNMRFNNDTMLKQFNALKMNGIYFRVIEEGELEAGDEFELIQESKFSITVLDVVECRASKGENQDKLKEILELPFIPDDLKDEFMVWLK
jgi:MOSC domain-containing protein YiiM